MASLSQRRLVVDGRPAEAWLSASPPGPPLLLLHGAGGCHLSLAPLGEALAEASPVLPSLPGRAGSEGPPLGSVAAMAAWVVALADALDLDRFFVGGHSLGGAIAIETALTHPGRVLGLALLSTGARLRVNPALLAAIEETAARGEHVEVSAAYHPSTDPALLRREFDAKQLTPPSTALADWRAVNAFDRLDRVSTLRAPTLVVGGDDDPLTPPKYARFLAERIAGARLALVAGASHMLPIERPREIAALLDAFVADQ